MVKNTEELLQEMIDDLCERGYEQDEIESVFTEILESDFLKDPQFDEEEKKLIYAIRVAGTRITKSPPVKAIELLWLGCYSPIYKKDGGFRGEGYAIDSKGLKQIAINNEEEYLYLNTLDSFTTYEFILAVGKRKTGEIFYIATDKVTSEEIDAISSREDKLELIKKYSKYVDKLNKVWKVPSKVNEVDRTDGKGKVRFTQHNDLRLVRGIIQMVRSGQRRDGKPYHMYNITDDTLRKEFTTKKGKYHPTRITCWATKIEWEEESDCYFAGSVTVDDDGAPSMNILCTIPVFARPKILLEE